MGSGSGVGAGVEPEQLHHRRVVEAHDVSARILLVPRLAQALVVAVKVQRLHGVHGVRVGCAWGVRGVWWVCVGVHRVCTVRGVVCIERAPHACAPQHTHFAQ